MPTLNIDGRTVNVDDGFLSLSPEDQNATVDEIHKSLGQAADSLTASNVLKSAADIPVLGHLARKANAAINATLAPAVDPLLPDTAEKLPEPTFGERYAHALRLLENDPSLQQFREQYPVLAAASNIGGTALAAGGLGATATGARLLGLGGGPGVTLAGQVARGIASGAGINAADAALGDQPLGEAALIGGALGAAAPMASSALRRLVTPLAPSAERTALANQLRNEGVDLTAGQATGNRALQWAESTFGDMPGAGGRPAAMMERQAEQFTGAALRRTGEVADRASSDVVNRAFMRIGQDFKTVGQRNILNADRQLGADLAAVEGEYQNLVAPGLRAPLVQKSIEGVWHDVVQNNGHITGEQYNAMTSRLAKQARGANADPQLQTALHDIRDALDDAFERSLTRSGNLTDLARLQQARRQYRNLMVIEKAATGAGSATAEGLISPSQLRSATVGQNRRMYARGQGDFADLARAGEAVLKPLPQSGTAPRLAYQHLLGIGGGLAGGFPGAAITGAVAPAIAGRVMMSRPMQAYFANQLLANRRQIGQLGVRAAAASLAAPRQAQLPYFPPGP